MSFSLEDAMNPERLEIIPTYSADRMERLQCVYTERT